MRIYENIMTAVNDVCNTYISTNVERVSDGIKDPAFALLVVYVIFWGFAHMMNLIQEPITDAIKRLVKIILIIGISFEVGTYNSYITEVITNVPEQIASLFSGTNNPTQMISMFDQLYKDIWNIGINFWDAGGITSGFGCYIAGAIIFILAVLITAYSAFLIVLSKIAISILGNRSQGISDEERQYQGVALGRNS
jgi:type IV secretory pathway VirB6-like protein